MEMIVVMSIFGVLMVSLFAIFQIGLSAWRKADVKNELLQSVQVASIRVSKEVERTAFESLSAESADQILAFLSPLDDDGRFVHTPNGKPLWQRYVVYYRDNVEQKLMRREITLDPAAPERQNPAPLEEADFGSGPQPLDSYRVDGQPVAFHIADFTPELRLEPELQVVWSLTAEKERTAALGPERLTQQSRAFPRN
jgi:hypothetical protein